MARYSVIVARVGEGEHEPSQFVEEANGVSLEEDGRLVIHRPEGDYNMAASSWGAFKVVRVESAGKRI